MRRNAADATATVARGAGKSGLLATAGAQQRPLVGAVKGTSADLTAGTAARVKGEGSAEPDAGSSGRAENPPAHFSKRPPLIGRFDFSIDFAAFLGPVNHTC